MKVHYIYIYDSYMYTMTDEGPLYIYIYDSYMYTMADDGPLYIYI